jgi:AraC-like DNA-binding protein
MPPLPSLSLHDWSCLRVELVWIYDHAAREQSRRGIFDHREGNWAWYLRRGRVQVESKAGVLTARTGDWMFVPAEIHHHEFSDDAILVSVRFRCQWPSGLGLFDSPPGAVVSGSLFPELEKKAGRLERFVRRHAPGAHWLHQSRLSNFPLFLQIQRLFLEWLEVWFAARVATGAIPARQPGDDRVSKAAQLLDTAPMEAGYPGESLRTTASLSTIQLKRLFKRQLGLTPVQYWERRRLENARLLLESSELPLKALAARLGFTSASHFAAWFKRHIGASPGRYRLQNSHA